MTADRIAFPTLLVVDDDARYCAVLTHLLAHLATIECCADGHAALARLRARHFDWVLLDIGLPGIDGFDVLAQVRCFAPATRVVIHTGMALPDGRRRAQEAGAVELLEKPLALAQLAALLAATGGVQSGVQTPRS